MVVSPVAVVCRHLCGGDGSHGATDVPIDRVMVVIRPDQCETSMIGKRIFPEPAARLPEPRPCRDRSRHSRCTKAPRNSTQQVQQSAGVVQQLICRHAINLHRAGHSMA